MRMSSRVLVVASILGACSGPVTSGDTTLAETLIDMSDALVAVREETALLQAQVDSLREPDIADRASSETDWGIELRTRDRQRKLIAKIDCAIRRLYEGEYGYCEVTGEPISLARLEARPIANMTLEAQERHERIEKVSRDD